jgi:hypothetical protein
MERRDEMNDDNLDEEMERDTQIRRDTQVRGSLGIPPSGGSGSTRDREEALPELDESSERGSAFDEEDRGSER